MELVTVTLFHWLPSNLTILTCRANTITPKEFIYQALEFKFCSRFALKLSSS